MSSSRRAITKLQAIILIVLVVVAGSGAAFYYLQSSAPKSAIKIGYVAMFTGTLTSESDDALKGAQLAVKEINAAGGINGRSVELVSRDGKSTATDSSLAMTQLITEDEVLAVLGAQSTAIAVPLAEIAQKEGVPFLPIYTADIKLLQRGYTYVFRIYTSSYEIIQAAGNFVASLAPKTIAVITLPYSAAMEQVNGTLDLAASKAGTQLLFVEKFTSGVTDWTPVLIKLRAANPDLLFFIAFTGDALLLLRQMREQGIKLKGIVGNWGPGSAGFLEQAGDLAEDVFVPLEWAAQMNSPGVEELNDRMVKEYGGETTAFRIDGYASTVVLCDAIKKVLDAGLPLTRENIREYLAKTDLTVPGVGRVKFSSTPSEHPAGEVNQNVYSTGMVLQIIEGRYVSVYPPDLAVAKPVYPPDLAVAKPVYPTP